MYRGFNLREIDLSKISIANQIMRYDNLKARVGKFLSDFVMANGSIDGSKLQDGWFPQLQCDIFISHSHKDKNNALALADILQRYGMSCFIDSCIWGHADDLLAQIDKKHSYKEESNTYDYNIRNITTSHVHMMLTSALSRMMDNAECVFFLNTPNSIIDMDQLKEKTVSPWLYNEILLTQIIRKQKPKRDLIKGHINEAETRNFSDAISVEYDINLSHLTKLSQNDFNQWLKNRSDWEHPLDTLYAILPPSTKS